MADRQKIRWKPGIKLGTAYGPRSPQGTRFPERARLAARTTIRRALRRPPEGGPRG